MNLRTSFEPVELSELGAMRRAYLDELQLAQVLLVELMLPQGDSYLIFTHDGEACGYFVVHGGDTLLELYLRPEYAVFGPVVLAQILHRLPVTRALVKSFDALLFSSCLPYQTAMRSLAWVAREYVERPLPKLDSVRFERRLAEIADLPKIEVVEQEVFRDPARLRHVIEQGLMHLFEWDGALIGFGIVRPIVAGRPDVELGIAVDRPFRNRGHAPYMLRAMVELAHAEGLNPVGSVSSDNPVSARMSVRIGFVPRHSLLELTLERPDKVRPLFVEARHGR